jgi:hypothetical protein
MGTPDRGASDLVGHSGGGDDGVGGDVALCGLTVHNSLRAQSVEKPRKIQNTLAFQLSKSTRACYFSFKRSSEIQMNSHQDVISTDYASSQLSVCILRKSCGNITAT